MAPSSISAPRFPSIISALAEFIVRFIESINLHLRMLQKSDVIYSPPTCEASQNLFIPLNSDSC
jgi:hypothetical protein